MEPDIEQPPPLLASFAKRLNDGEVIAFPTETYYGLLARIDRPQALRRIFILKGRSAQVALPVIVADAGTAFSLWRDPPPAARLLTDRFWPGPLTLVSPAATDKVDPLITGDTGQVGVRLPGSAAARGIAAMAGGALVATSANPSRQPPATSAAEVAAYFGDQVAVADGPQLPPSRGSTVLSLAEWPPRLLRDGDLDYRHIETLLEVALTLGN
ncbi:MAG: Sua5/YciO/YrdC/YwlC family protein [Myxococcales bacterium]|nr:Sua5/YciO/YrdC/YwlC family protein [Myxococcales bacterium]